MQTDGTDLGGSLCSVSPSDQVGTLDNILSRLEALEKAVQELQSQDISANQLSDISQAAGWLYNVTYMGQPGWTQTPAGTLIPPAGVSLSSLGILMNNGNPYQFVSQDSDGVLTFGINPTGGQSGGGGGGITDYRILKASSTTLSFGAAQLTSLYSAGSVITLFGTTTIRMSQAGLYLISANMVVNTSSTPSTALMETTVYNQDTTDPYIHVEDWISITGAINKGFQYTFAVLTDHAAAFAVSFSNVASLGNTTDCVVSCVKLA